MVNGTSNGLQNYIGMNSGPCSSSKDSDLLGVVGSKEYNAYVIPIWYILYPLQIPSKKMMSKAEMEPEPLH